MDRSPVLLWQMLYEMPPTAVVGAASTPDESEAALARARELLGS